MLDAFVIEEIKRRDRNRGREDRPVVELPLPLPNRPADSNDSDEGGPDRGRGVVIIDYTG